MGKHGIPDFFEDTLGYGYHNTVVKQCAYNTGNINTCHDDYRFQEGIKYRIGFQKEGCDIVIDKCLYVQRGCHTGKGTDDNTQEYQEKAKFIMKNIL